MSYNIGVEKSAFLYSQSIEALRTSPKRVGILTKRHIAVLNYSAQGYSYEESAEKLGISYSSVRQGLQEAASTLNTKTSLQSVQKALDLGFIDKKTLKRGFNWRKFQLLSDRERETLEKFIENWGENSEYENLANALNRSESSVAEDLGNAYTKLGIANGVKVAALYKISRGINYKDNSAFYLTDLDENEDSSKAFTELDINLLLTIPRRRLAHIADKISNTKQLASHLEKIRHKIGTLPRLKAFVEGLNTGVVILPPRTEKEDIDVNQLSKTHLAKQILLGIPEDII